MKHILSAVMERLQAEVPELQYIAEDWGQMDFYQDTPPVKFQFRESDNWYPPC